MTEQYIMKLCKDFLIFPSKDFMFSITDTSLKIRAIFLEQRLITYYKWEFNKLLNEKQFYNGINELCYLKLILFSNYQFFQRKISAFPQAILFQYNEFGKWAVYFLHAPQTFFLTKGMTFRPVENFTTGLGRDLSFSTKSLCIF